MAYTTRRVITDADVDNTTVRINPVTQKLEAINPAVIAWTLLPDKYLPTPISGGNMTVMIRISGGLYEVRINVARDIRLSSWTTNTSGGKIKLPYEWSPEYPVTVMVGSGFGSMGRLYIEDSGLIGYSGNSLRASEHLSNYQAIRQSKAAPTNALP